MGEDRAALESIATTAKNIRDMEVLEVADKHVSVTARFGIMDENEKLTSEMLKTIVDIYWIYATGRETKIGMQSRGAGVNVSCR